jgi:hypothetical protein
LPKRRRGVGPAPGRTADRPPGRSGWRWKTGGRGGTRPLGSLTCRRENRTRIFGRCGNAHTRGGLWAARSLFTSWRSRRIGCWLPAKAEDPLGKKQMAGNRTSALIGSVWETGKRPVCPRFSTVSPQGGGATAPISVRLAGQDFGKIGKWSDGYHIPYINGYSYQQGLHGGYAPSQ